MEEIKKDIAPEATEETPEAPEQVDESASLKEEIEVLKEKNLRLTAEFQNYRRRTEKEKSDIYKFANEKFITELLPVLDNIERALLSIQGAEDHGAVVDGVNLIKKNFDEFLKKEGVEVIEAVGTPFDPNYHHAVLSEESEEHEEGVVLEEYLKGYKLKEKVIRPTMVKVSK